MAFVRSAWHVLVGIKDFLVLLLLLLFFGALWSALSGRAEIRVPDGGALVLSLDGAVVDQAAEVDPLQALIGSDFGSERQVRDIIRAIDTAAKRQEHRRHRA